MFDKPVDQGEQRPSSSFQSCFLSALLEGSEITIKAACTITRFVRIIRYLTSLCDVTGQSGLLV